MTTPQLPRGALAAPRQLAAWAIVGYAALYLVFVFFDWVLPDGATFGVRSATADFTDLIEVALPLIAVLLASGAGVAPAVSQARSIATVAVVLYAAMVVFGALAWLIGLGSIGGGRGADATLDAMAYVVLGLARLGLTALAGLVTYQAWVRLGGSPVRLARTTPPTG